MRIENRFGAEHRSKEELGKEVEKRAKIIKQINETLKEHK